MSTNGLPLWLTGKESTCNAGDPGDLDAIPGSGRYLGGGHGNSFQCSCLENLMDRRAWWAIVHRVAESDMTEATEHTHMRAHGNQWGFFPGSEWKRIFQQCRRSGFNPWGRMIPWRREWQPILISLPG